MRSNSIPSSPSPAPPPSQSVTSTSAHPAPPRPPRFPENLSLALTTLDGTCPCRRPPPVPPPTAPTVDTSTSVKASMPPPRALERPGCRSARFSTSLGACVCVCGVLFVGAGLKVCGVRAGRMLRQNAEGMDGRKDGMRHNCFARDAGGVVLAFHALRVDYATT